MKERAEVDVLTAAYCRWVFEELVSAAVTRARRARLPLSLVHFDVDNLQELNDLHGKERLDEALSWLAATVARVIDGQGPIGRVGGDELAVLLEGVGAGAAEALAERARAAVAEASHSGEAGVFRLTLCAGVASLRPVEPPGNLLDAAAEACLRAKQSGKDAVASRFRVPDKQ